MREALLFSGVGRGCVGGAGEGPLIHVPRSGDVEQSFLQTPEMDAVNHYPSLRLSSEMKESQNGYLLVFPLLVVIQCEHKI